MKRTDKIVIERQPELCSQREYDLIIIGGGIYGVMLALQAVFRGLSPLLLERKDFGSGTSFNSLRIVHGGLRYLQSLDIRRFLESVRERRWFLTNFPDLVHPLPCLMPLYGDGLRRKSVLRAALIINDLLSLGRNRGVPSENELPACKVCGHDETITEFPAVQTRGLQGAARWYDAAMPDSQRVLMEALRWAAVHGADAINYAEVVRITTSANSVYGVEARDRSAGTELSFRAPVVINAAGPWCMDIAEMNDSASGQFFWPSLAWNLLTDKQAPSECALAIVPERNGAPIYFIHPWKGRMLVGTGHAAWDGQKDSPSPSGDQIQLMLDDVNSAIPGLELTVSNVDRVFAGLLPATGPESGEISTRPVILDHSTAGGPRGLISVCGIKFTTSRHVAQMTLDRIYGKGRERGEMKFRRPVAARGWQVSGLDLSDDRAVQHCLSNIGRLVSEESALNLQDVIFRRTNLWEERETACSLAPRICDLFAWPESRRNEELEQLRRDVSFGATVPRNLNNERSAESGSKARAGMTT